MRKIARHPRRRGRYNQVAQAQIFIERLGIDREGEKDVRAIQNRESLSGTSSTSPVGVSGFCSGTRETLPSPERHLLMSELMGFLRSAAFSSGRRRPAQITLPIAQIDEDDAAMIADDVDPTGERRGRADVGLS
jgi:hypothetical protein